jgi:ribosomal protein L11 methyltransferase
VQIDVARERAELAADALWRAGPSAVVEVELGGGRVRLSADVADPSLVDPTWAAVVVAAGDEAYLDAWRTWAAPVRAGHRVELRPAWLERGRGGSDDDLVVVVLDPGRAFGSGSHESTRLAVAAVEAHVRPGHRVLDVGSGSGVLSVLSCLLGAASVDAVDVAPDAVAATLANAARNGVEARVRAVLGEVTDVAAEHDVVVANIGGSVLFDLAPELAARVAPGGLLLLAGILDERADELVAYFPGFAEVERRSEAGWAGLVLRRQRWQRGAGAVGAEPIRRRPVSVGS